VGVLFYTPIKQAGGLHITYPHIFDQVAEGRSERLKIELAGIWRASDSKQLAPRYWGAAVY